MLLRGEEEKGEAVKVGERCFYWFLAEVSGGGRRRSQWVIWSPSVRTPLLESKERSGITGDSGSVLGMRPAISITRSLSGAIGGHSVCCARFITWDDRLESLFRSSSRSR